jgi:hypothetical protein
MAYYLNFGANDYVQAPFFNYGASLVVEWQMSLTYQGNRQWIFFNGAEGQAGRVLQLIVESNATLKIDNWGTAVSVPLANLPTPIDRVSIYRFENDANGSRLYQNNTLIINAARLLNPGFTPSGNLKIGAYGNGGFNAKNMQLYYFDVEIDGVAARYFDPSASNGTGLALLDTVGANDGTLINFPADNSQWVFYATGPNTPINLGFANLQPNSVRFTWEQG